MRSSSIWFARRGYDSIAFDGPGQGGMLEDQHVLMTADWHRPGAAVLDALGLDDVELIGGSLGGCLVIRAAAFERRVQRVVAYDVMTDFHECLAHQLPQAVRPLVGALEHTGALMDALMNIASTKRAGIEWGLQQAMRPQALSPLPTRSQSTPARAICAPSPIRSK